MGAHRLDGLFSGQIMITYHQYVCSPFLCRRSVTGTKHTILVLLRQTSPGNTIYPRLRDTDTHRAWGQEASNRLVTSSEPVQLGWLRSDQASHLHPSRSVLSFKASLVVHSITRHYGGMLYPAVGFFYVTSKLHFKLLGFSFVV